MKQLPLVAIVAASQRPCFYSVVAICSAFWVTYFFSAVVIRIIEVGFNISHSNTPLHYVKVVAMYLYLQNGVVLCVVHYQLIMSYSVQLPEIFGRTMMKIVNKSNENLLIDHTRLEVSDVLQVKKHFRSWILVKVTQLFIINLNCGDSIRFYKCCKLSVDFIRLLIIPKRYHTDTDIPVCRYFVIDYYITNIAPDQLMLSYTR